MNMSNPYLYVISAQVLSSERGFSGSRQIPTFYLDPAVQGINSLAHAEQIAKTVIDPMDTLELSISVDKREILIPPF
jgi:hypothetical protein